METKTIKKSLFNEKFTAIKTVQITNALKNDGYYAFEGALNEQFVDELLREINFDQVLLNTNDVGVVKANEIQYLTHCLASSKIAYNIITSSKVMEICSAFFNDTFRLTNHRIYQTYKRSDMPWHTDNNIQDGDHLTQKHDMPGLLFLFYLSDVDQNAFQFIKNSHLWSQKYDGEIYLGNKYVENKYGKDVLSFLMKRGSLILCNTHGIHRAEPFNDKKYKRITLLFQVDQVGHGYEGHGEKNIVNTEYLRNLTPELMDYLGFGFKRNYPAFPSTSISTLTIKDIVKLQSMLMSKIFGVMTKTFVKSVLPASAIVRAKQIRWHLKRKKEIQERHDVHL